LVRKTWYKPNTTEGTAKSNKPVAEKVFAGVKACGPAAFVPV
jgi:hypothetical protein